MPVDMRVTGAAPTSPSGSGTTKKHAEQEAARLAYQKLLREGEEPQTSASIAEDNMAQGLAS